MTFKDGKPNIYHFDRRAVGWDHWSMSSDLISNSPGTTGDKIELPAEEIAHLFQRTGVPGQWRGVSELAPILFLLYELDDLSDAMIAKQKAAQAISWIIKNSGPTTLTPVGSPVNAINYGTGETKQILKANGGGAQYLNRGEDLIQVEGVGVGPQVIDLIKLELHRIAQAGGINYEMLTGDLTEVNLSTMQHLALELRTTAEHYYKIFLIPIGLKKICYWFHELAALYSSRVAKAIPDYRYPRRYSVQALKDTQNAGLEMQYDINTWLNILEERGLTPEQVIADKKLREENGILIGEPAASLQARSAKANSNTKGK